MATFNVDLGTAIPKGIRWAGRAAFRSDHPIHKVGAALVWGSNLIVDGHNKNRSHPRSPHKFCIHAEVDVLIRNITWPGNRTTMYVVRITKGGQWATSKPCERCWMMMKEYGVDSVTYIDEKGEIKTEKL